jgi:hypothetical protein
MRLLAALTSNVVLPTSGVASLAFTTSFMMTCLLTNTETVLIADSTFNLYRYDPKAERHN